MSFPVCSAILLCVPWGEALLTDVRTRTAARLRLQTQLLPWLAWGHPQRLFLLRSLLISFIPASPGSSVPLNHFNIAILHIPGWIFLCCCPSGGSYQFYLPAGKQMPQDGHRLGWPMLTSWDDCFLHGRKIRTWDWSLQTGSPIYSRSIWPANSLHHHPPNQRLSPEGHCCPGNTALPFSHLCCLCASFAQRDEAGAAVWQWPHLLGVHRSLMSFSVMLRFIFKIHHISTACFSCSLQQDATCSSPNHPLST